ncbi:hypothetical protein MKW92_048517 [Papaver armeniacum]|nr:hypothetical protein MKW92_048517 [Papaver armeniacum]
MYVLFSLSSLLIIQYPTVQAQQYRFHYCYGDNYTTNSTFQANLNLLLPSLTSTDPSNIKNGYYEATVGQNQDIVYGSLQCRGDVPQDVCQVCVQRSAKQLENLEGCSNSKQAIIWYDLCMLRYSNQTYFNIRQDTPMMLLRNYKDISNPNQFRPILRDFMDRLTREVAVNNGSTKFAAGDTNLTDTTKLYGYVQCTADISSSDCNRGLLETISELRDCCDVYEGGQSLKPSFNVRFEFYPLFPSMASPSPPPQSSSPAPHVSPPSSTNTTPPYSNGKKSFLLPIIIVVPSVVAVLLAICFWFFCFRRKKRQTENSYGADDEIQSTESFQFNFSTISAATNNFSEANKLGEGGFGSVYKGTLSNEKQIAVKRLSENSGQGEQEFKNEVTLVAKLQHKNLVKLVGFSLAGEEKLLIYEFMPNASLDQYLFDPIKCTQLDWKRRHKIIRGVARGLVYLHDESRLKIVHRDLKASNILLDMDMNPKIADFGMARLIVPDQTQASTKRIVGTHGYMAPEYVLHGHFSVKSDVFSFGILVLEIVSGKRNNSFQKTDIAPDLLSYVWRHWNNGSTTDILDPTLKDICPTNEVVRCIHVALLCVQENVADRPTMPTVVQMLNTYSAINPDLPSAPAFLADSKKDDSISEAGTWSVNEVTITEPYPR